MQLNCPYCGESISYELSMAGHSIVCSYCEHSLKMPSFEELPEELREEVHRTESRRQEKSKRKYRRKQEAVLRKMEKEEENALRAEEEQRRKQAKDAEEAAYGDQEQDLETRYRALRFLVRWNLAIAGLVVAGYLLCAGLTLLGTLMSGLSMLTPLVMASALSGAKPALMAAFFIWVGGELTKVLLGAADDIHATRTILRSRAGRPPQAAAGPPNQASGLSNQASGPPNQASGPPNQASGPPNQASGPADAAGSLQSPNHRTVGHVEENWGGPTRIVGRAMLDRLRRLLTEGETQRTRRAQRVAPRTLRSLRFSFFVAAARLGE